MVCASLTPPQPPDTTRPELRSEYVGIAPARTGGTWVLVEISNTSNGSAGGFWVDVFANRTAPPTLGLRSSSTGWVSSLAPRSQTMLWVYTPTPYTAVTWIDVIVDSSLRIAEAYEWNNVYSVDFP